ncbi:hypothetical protein HQ585_17065, partial [candidate division KSB1 bacterium]|nr:hypothetical protein [candidate division KSB1 bacterium]
LDLFFDDVIGLEVKLEPTVLEGETVEISARNLEKMERQLETFRSRLSAFLKIRKTVAF